MQQDQLTALIDELRRDNDCIAAAQMDVSDTQARLKRAEQGLEACKARADITKRRIDRLIEARSHSGYDDEPILLEGP